MSGVTPICALSEAKGMDINMEIKNLYVQYMYSYPHKTAYRRLDSIRLEDYASHLEGGGHGLYLHVPFCQSKCGYCNLFSATGQDEDGKALYFQAVERQIRQYQEILRPWNTSFADFVIGGGTPLSVTERQLFQMFAMVRKHFCLEDGASIVIETAPNQTTAEKLRILKDAGCTRVSMGIQSFDDGELKTLRRSHGGQRARASLNLLKDFGFPCVNVDFIYGIPGQSAGSFLNSLKEAVTYEPDEIFLYPLYVKHGVALERDLERGMVLEPELAFLQYREGAAFLKSQGYRQDSMRRFVREKSDGRKAISKAQDGQTYQSCGFGTSLALGCGGRSYLGNLHFCTPYGVERQRVLDEIARFEATRDYGEISHGFLLSPDEQKRRYLIRQLLMLPGVSRADYTSHFHSEIFADFPVLSQWKKDGWLQENEQFVFLSQEGLGLSDFLGPQLISDDVGKKMEEWNQLACREAANGWLTCQKGGNGQLEKKGGGLV